MVRRVRLHFRDLTLHTSPTRSPPRASLNARRPPKDRRFPGDGTRRRAGDRRHRADAARRFARRSGDGRVGQQLLELAHADSDRDRRQLLRDHGDRRDGRDHLRRNRPVGGVDLRAERRDDGARAPIGGADEWVRGDAAWFARCAGRRFGLRSVERRAGRRPSRAPVHRHARNDVDAARHRVRCDAGGEHSGAAVAHRGDEGVARVSAAGSIPCRCWRCSASRSSAGSI